MHALCDGVVSFFSFQLPLARMDLIFSVERSGPGEKLRAACPKDHLNLCRIEKFDFLKLCQDKGF